jgi:hypothetical protein
MKRSPSLGAAGIAVAPTGAGFYHAEEGAARNLQKASRSVSSTRSSSGAGEIAVKTLREGQFSETLSNELEIRH